MWSKSNVQNHNGPERFDPKHKSTKEGTKTDQEKTTTPYRKMNGQLHTDTDEMFGQRQISRGHFCFFLNTGVWGGIFFPPIKKKAQKCMYEGKKAEIKQ